MLMIEVEYGISGAEQERIYTGFVEAMLWAEHYFDEQGNDRGAWQDHYDIEDISNDAESQIKADIDGFVNLCEGQGIDLHALDYRTERFANIGHDFYLTRQGHGVGFWDRGFGQVGEELTKWAKTYGSINLYDSDGEVFVQ